jgi:sugar/nucleoside kinase (ribokinase family)
MFVVVGYLLHDVNDNNGRVSSWPGGAAIYCGLAARKLGMKVGLVSRAGKDYKYRHLIEGMDLAVNFSEKSTTTFFNTYRGENRTQGVENVGRKITGADFPRRFLDADAIHIGPVIDEIEPSLLEHVRQNSRALVSMDPQGFMRRCDSNGNVLPKELNLDLLRYVDVVHISEDDSAAAQLDSIVRVCPRVLFTKGSKGSEIYWNGKRFEVPAYPIPALADPTGGGDTYTAAFVKRLLDTHDPEESGYYAGAAASFCVEGVGISNLPTNEMVVERMRNFQH